MRSLAPNAVIVEVPAPSIASRYPSKLMLRRLLRRRLGRDGKESRRFFGCLGVLLPGVIPVRLMLAGGQTAD